MSTGPVRHFYYVIGDNTARDGDDRGIGGLFDVACGVVQRWSEDVDAVGQ
ncbi:hypothetical protein AB0425_41680 [Actinosynnema sp. NPDC051121]